jgi:hypothetical protein
MGLMIGNTEAHKAMNNMMINIMGKEGKKAIHIAMGKRISRCAEAQLPREGIGFMPMMHMTMWGWSRTPTFWNGGVWAVFSRTFIILWWLLMLAGIVAIIRWLISQSKPKSPISRITQKIRAWFSEYFNGYTAWAGQYLFEYIRNLYSSSK